MLLGWSGNMVLVTHDHFKMGDVSDVMQYAGYTNRCYC